MTSPVIVLIYLCNTSWERRMSRQFVEVVVQKETVEDKDGLALATGLRQVDESKSIGQQEVILSGGHTTQGFNMHYATKEQEPALEMKETELEDCSSIV